MRSAEEFKEWLNQSKAYLHFEDGKTFEGKINLKKDDPALKKGIWGEAAFTTGMAGYQETMTDPSFLGQHIIFSTSHVGNYAADASVNQSEKCHASCLMARNFSPNQFLESTNVPLFSDFDSRALVKYLVNSKNLHTSVVSSSSNAPSKEEFKRAELKCNELERVSQKEARVIIPGNNPIVLINYGVKQAIVDNLKGLGLPLVSLPFNSTLEQIKSYDPQLVFLSNGPGDPRTYYSQIEVVKELLTAKVPIRAICLGHQLLTLALGAEVVRLPFGQRGANHPVLNLVDGDIMITSQNHGYAAEEESLKKVLKNNPLNREILIHSKSLFDQSVEGLTSVDHFLKSVQYHPEASPGPKDAAGFFSEIKEYLTSKNIEAIDTTNLQDFKGLDGINNKVIPYNKILLIGSGPIKIGQASEFDYSGTQACKALKELGVKVVLLNSNPATIMTDPDMAYKTYIEPITKETIKKIICEEKVDAVLSTMGGQTALNICVELEEEEYLQSQGVKLLGANVDTIKKTEDRGLFAKELAGLGYQTGKRFRAKSEEEALKLAGTKVGYPLIIRRDFALGGRGSALVHNQSGFKEIFTTDLKFPITMEKSLLGWKEVELEVMVDQDKNGVIICSIENIDPCGVHTGDSITVAPAQTISDRCYQQLRDISLHVAKHMGVVAGGANVQFAVNPNNENDIVVIEMNPRVSRSSALASKATGYPIAKISALLAVGYTLPEILNDITKASPVAFEPTLDYVALKIPIFPFNKFPSSSQELGPQMRSVGEVLALGSNFNEAFLKALRSLEMGLEIPLLNQLKTTPIDIDIAYIIERLKNPRQLCLLTVLEGLRRGMTIKEIYKLTSITPWFIEQVKEIQVTEEKVSQLKASDIDRESFINLKKLGFSDKYLALLTNCSQNDILKIRFEQDIFPVYKAVDTCSGEFNALTPYFYSTYYEETETEALSKNNRSMAILGSGPNRIGQGIEFDYSCVKSCQHLKNQGIKAIMINSNPETVSTDYDSSDRLYLAALYSEDLFDIFKNENPEGIITSFSGQTGISIREHIEKSFRKNYLTFNFLGSSLETLHLTEDRKAFSDISKEVDLSHTVSREIRGYKNLVNAMIEIGLPVIIRPSFVIGGESMYIFKHHDDINHLPDTLREQLKSSSTVFQVETYLQNATEYDVDLVRDGSGNTAFTVCEHIEHAGVHSGDSGMISPPVALTRALYKKMKEISIDLAKILDVVGPVNFQFAVKDGLIYCIEANPRGSRTLPFLSKAYNISLPQIATDAMIGLTIENWDQEFTDHFCVKQSTFPFDRFVLDNIILGPKMRSTGETMGIDRDKEKAILKSYLGNYPNINTTGKILISMADRSKEVLLPYLKALHKMGYQYCATDGTYHYIKKQGLPCELIAKIEEDSGTTILEILKEENMKMVFNTPMSTGSSKSDGEHIRNSAIQYGIPCFTRPENIEAVMQAILGSHKSDLVPLALQDLH
ncbi:MAG: carbamoyl-phosphate synthase large subunit [Halobacteriovoraceae bacterium]|jgi:carbamoyl-phosphate synthase large subunit|nr:carbamoyl-phosphate synthase large subunit [Halobacteriovoraceae bacterium]